MVINDLSLPQLRLGVPTMQRAGQFTGFKDPSSALGGVYQGLGGIGSYQKGIDPSGRDLTQAQYDDKGNLTSAAQGSWVGGQVGGTFVPYTQLDRIQQNTAAYNPNLGNTLGAGQQQSAFIEPNNPDSPTHAINQLSDQAFKNEMNNKYSGG